MKLWELVFLAPMLYLVYKTAGQSVACPESCGDTRIHFPFGTAEGCGDPDHKLSCEDDHFLTLSVQGGSIIVVSINYTSESLTINTTATPWYYEDSCNPVLNTEAYDVRQEENLGCRLNAINGGDLEFPANYPASQNGCFFKRGVEIPVPYIIPGELGLVLQCYNYTRERETSIPTPPSYSIWSYATLPWIVKREWASRCERCNNSENICGYSTSDESFQCKSRVSGVALSSSSSSNSRRTMIGAIVGATGGAALLFICLGGCFILKRRQAMERRKYILDDMDPSSKQKVLGSSMGSSHNLSSPGSYEVYSSPGNARFTLRELEEATDNFSEAGLLGDGGFGTVYKGKLRDGRLVAVKKLNPWNAQGRSQFQNEVNILSQVTHPNLVRLYGCCSEAREHLLVYEFIASGTLADHIHDCRAGFMDWDKRLTVVLETAEALAWLHNNVSPPIFHRDVKSTNILIDEGYHAKVGDFGLSRLVPSLELTHVTTAPQGTPGYLDPDYHQSYQLTDKSDVYSFGVVLMEIVSSQRAVDMSRDRKEINLAALAVSRIQCGQLDKLVDPRLGTDDDPVRWRMVEGVAELSFECLAAEKDDRPCMRTVAQRLRQIYEEGKREYLEQMKAMSRGGSINSNMKDRSFNVTSDSPTSVQNLWHSNSTSPNDSNSSL